MQNHDEFESSGLGRATASIFAALDFRNRIRARGPLFTVGPVVVMLAIVAGVLWYSYPREAQRQEIRTVPIIRADASEWRSAPQDPGGEEIPWRDSTIFETLRSARNEAPVENLLPGPEQPLERSKIFAGLKIDAQNGDGVASESEEESAGITVAASEPEPSVPQPVVKPTAQKVEASDGAAEAAAKTEPAAGAALRQETVREGDFFVQLGSLREESAAQRSWKDLQSAFPDDLGALGVRVQNVDLGARGMFYRVQGGPVTRDQAQSICQAIEAKRPGGCLVVPR